jgi:hypothetical protein
VLDEQGAPLQLLIVADGHFQCPARLVGWYARQEVPDHRLVMRHQMIDSYMAMHYASEGSIWKNRGSSSSSELVLPSSFARVLVTRDAQKQRPQERARMLVRFMNLRMRIGEVHYAFDEAYDIALLLVASVKNIEPGPRAAQRFRLALLAWLGCRCNWRGRACGRRCRCSLQLQLLAARLQCRRRQRCRA